MSTATTTSHDTSQHTTSRTITQPTANPTRPLRCPGTPYHDDGLSARCPARSGRAECLTRGCHCGRQDRRVTPVGLRSVPLGGSGGCVCAVGRCEWRAGAESRAGGVGRLRKHRGEQARDGDLLPSRWNHVGWCASGPLATAEEREAAAGQAGEGHGVGGGFGDGDRAGETEAVEADCRVLRDSAPG